VRGKFSFLPKSADNPQPQQPYFQRLVAAYYELTLISSIRWNMVGLAFRFWGYSSLLAFQYSFFGFFMKPAVFGYASLAILLTGGIASNFIASVLAVKLT
jgi:hypothetical protein